jgi:hypothetical protein
MATQSEELQSLIAKRAEQTKKAFEEYALALGKVAHAWNYLHEKLGRFWPRNRVQSGRAPGVASKLARPQRFFNYLRMLTATSR